MYRSRRESRIPTPPRVCDKHSRGLRISSRGNRSSKTGRQKRSCLDSPLTYSLHQSEALKTVHPIAYQLILLESHPRKRGSGIPFGGPDQRFSTICSYLEESSRTTSRPCPPQKAKIFVIVPPTPRVSSSG